MKYRYFLALGMLLGGALQAADMREWMSRKGSVLQAKLGGVSGDAVTLVDANARQVKLKIEDLSLADRQYLVEFGGADAAAITGGKVGLVEKEMRLDASTFKRLETKLLIPDGPSEGFELFETPHFLIATAGKVRPQAVAETAERLWYGMAFQHMNFLTDWSDKRMLVMLVEDAEFYDSLGKWYVSFIGEKSSPETAAKMKTLWPRMGSTSIVLPEELATHHKLHEQALLFQVKENSLFRKPLGPFMIHALAGQLLSKQMGWVSSYGSQGYFALMTGHSYFKEITLGGESETQLLAVEGSLQDEISSKSGFDDGSSWARSLRSMVRSGKVTPNLTELTKWSSDQLTPERLVLIYSLACYMQGDMKRLSQYASMVRRIESSKQVPVPEEIAKIFGFNSIEELDADWTKFIKEGDFR
jgi:hypothetical protein